MDARGTGSPKAVERGRTLNRIGKCWFHCRKSSGSSNGESACVTIHAQGEKSGKAYCVSEMPPTRGKRTSRRWGGKTSGAEEKKEASSNMVWLPDRHKQGTRALGGRAGRGRSRLAKTLGSAPSGKPVLRSRGKEASKVKRVGQGHTW